MIQTLEIKRTANSLQTTKRPFAGFLQTSMWEPLPLKSDKLLPREANDTRSTLVTGIIHEDQLIPNGFTQQPAYTQLREECRWSRGTGQADDWMLERERTGQPLLYGKFQGIFYPALSRQALSSLKPVERTHSRMCQSLHHGRIKG